LFAAAVDKGHGIAAAIGLSLTLTGDRRVSLLMAALSAVAPGSIVLSMLHAEALKRVTTFPATS
jgi:hypothetical protein